MKIELKIKNKMKRSEWLGHWFQQKQYICITFLQLRPNIFDFGQTLYKCYINVWNTCSFRSIYQMALLRSIVWLTEISFDYWQFILYYQITYFIYYLIIRTSIEKYKETPIHSAHDVVATLNQRNWRWYNVAITSCAQWDNHPSCMVILERLFWRVKYPCLI